MNKLYKILAVSFLMFSHTSWSMLIPHQPSGSSFKKSPVVLNRSFYEHQEMVKELRVVAPMPTTAEEFLHVFGKHTLSKTGKIFCALEKEERYKVMSRLSEKQRIWLRIGANSDLDFCLLFSFFNGNEKMARACCNISIDGAMQRYANAQEMRIKYPITIDGKSCGEQHYMGLTSDQICALSKVMKNGTIHESEINEFMGGLDKLEKIDPNVICDKKGLTDSIRLYPSLSERANVFWNAPGIWNVPGNGGRLTHFCFCNGIWNGIGDISMALFLMKNRAEELEWYTQQNAPSWFIREKVGGWDKSINIGLSAGCISFGIAGLCGGIQFASKYPNYQNDLKNVLLNQPTLTDVLKNKNS